MIEQTWRARWKAIAKNYRLRLKNSIQITHFCPNCNATETRNAELEAAIAAYAAQQVGDIEQRRELRTTIEQLERWKREACEVMTKWEAVWDALGRPGKLGRSKAEGALAEVVKLKDAGLCDTDGCSNVVNYSMPGFCNACHNVRISRLFAQRDEARTDAKTARDAMRVYIALCEQEIAAPPNQPEAEQVAVSDAIGDAYEAMKEMVRVGAADEPERLRPSAPPPIRADEAEPVEYSRTGGDGEC